MCLCISASNLYARRLLFFLPNANDTIVVSVTFLFTWNSQFQFQRYSERPCKSNETHTENKRKQERKKETENYLVYIEGCEAHSKTTTTKNKHIIRSITTMATTQEIDAEQIQTRKCECVCLFL